MLLNKNECTEEKKGEGSTQEEKDFTGEELRAWVEEQAQEQENEKERKKKELDKRERAHFLGKKPKIVTSFIPICNNCDSHEAVYIGVDADYTIFYHVFRCTGCRTRILLTLNEVKEIFSEHYEMYEYQKGLGAKVKEEVDEEVIDEKPEVEAAEEVKAEKEEKLEVKPVPAKEKPKRREWKTVMLKIDMKRFKFRRKRTNNKANKTLDEKELRKMVEEKLSQKKGGFFEE